MQGRDGTFLYMLLSVFKIFEYSDEALRRAESKVYSSK